MIYGALIVISHGIPKRSAGSCTVRLITVSLDIKEDPLGSSRKHGLVYVFIEQHEEGKTNFASRQEFTSIG